MNFIKRYYINEKENKIKYLQRKTEVLKNEIAGIENEIIQKCQIFSSLEFENKTLKEQYNLEKKLLKQRWIIFNIINKSFKINQWDNLYLTASDKNLAIITKDGQILKVLSNRVSNALSDVITGPNSYSMIVIRVDGNSIKIQFRLK